MIVTAGRVHRDGFDTGLGHECLHIRDRRVINFEVRSGPCRWCGETGNIEEIFAVRFLVGRFGHVAGRIQGTSGRIL